jgi:S1-C subfamily serine protease
MKGVLRLVLGVLTVAGSYACGAGLAPAAARADTVEAQLAAADRVERAREDLIARLSPTVISVFRVQANGDLAPSAGSGVVISADGYALTNFHVAGDVTARSNRPGQGPSRDFRVGLPGGKILKAKLCGVDRTGDVALIKIESPSALPFARLGSNARLRVGEWIIAMGNPFLLATDFRPTVSFGVVSGLHRYLTGDGLFQKDLIYADAIQIDAALNPGNSGGALFNMAGELVGINGRISPRVVAGLKVQKKSGGIGFAVPIDGIKLFLDELKAGHEVDRGYLGATSATAEEDGARIEAIAVDSPAELFGLRPGDVVLRVEGEAVHGPGEMENLIQLHPAGTRITLQIRRDGKVFDQQVQLGGIQATAALGIGELRDPFRVEAKPAKEDKTPGESAPENEAKPEPKKDGP